MASEDSPNWISAILRWPLLWHAARLLLVSAYLLGGLTKLLDFAVAAAEQAHFGLHPGWLWAATAIVVELGGSLLVVLNRFVWLGAGGLGILTFVAMLTANAFWTMGGHEKFMATNAFFEHLGLIAGLVIVSIVSDEPSSDPSRAARSQAVQGVSQ
ncbi:DoxX family protein [Bradyrhizobium sp. McL0616]|uniref:DoxX family protein n=1 Tax=Bradyrhizobium sp. McL0616 TaxID=3415674 RepID=UPI003CE8D73E